VIDDIKEKNKEARSLAAAMKKRETSLKEKVDVNLKDIKTNDESLVSLETQHKTNKADDEVLRKDVTKISQRIASLEDKVQKGA